MHATEAPAVNTTPKLGDNGGKDNLTHLFCPEQEHWTTDPGFVATARCGKTKSGWRTGTGKDLLCTVCLEMHQTSSCAHCQKGADK